MPIRALAVDYDGTIATEGTVEDATSRALERLKAAGLKLILVTGRQLDDLFHAFPGAGLFHAVVAENGALLFQPQEAEPRRLAPPPPGALLEALERRGVRPLWRGSTVVATLRDQAETFREVLQALGLDWALILNKDSLMCLPAGVDKASGLAHALETLGLAAEEVIGVGDAENDLPFLEACGISAAVENALPDLKRQADLVTEGAAGAGVAWLAERLLAGGLDAVLTSPRRAR